MALFMKQNEKEIWLNIRTEQIKKHVDNLNKGKIMNTGFSIEEARKIASYQLEVSLESEDMLLTLEELLLLSDEECEKLIRNRTDKRLREVILQIFDL